MKITEIGNRINYLLCKVNDENITLNELKELESLLFQSHGIIEKGIENEIKIRRERKLP